MNSEKDSHYSRPVLLVLMTVVSLYSGLVTGKRAASIKAEMRDSADAEKETLRAEFRKVHAISSILNMAVLALGIVFIFLTSMKL